MTDTEEFIEKLNTEGSGHINAKPTGGNTPANEYRELRAGDSTQWALRGDGVFSASSATVQQLPGSVYRTGYDQYGNVIFTQVKVITDELIRLPDNSGAQVIDGIQRFWDSEHKFKQFGQIFKRGVLLWGAPGSGKTTTVMLLIEDLIRRGGIVLLVADPDIAVKGLTQLRRIEPDRKLICILEDLDELTERYGEAQLLALLDGESQTNNVVYIASTNYPERLDARLVNRPSRFDEVIKIGMPTPEARRVYLRSRLTIEDVTEAGLNRWVEDTEGLSIAHLRELVVAVFCLGRGYVETLKRLKSMQKTPKSSGGNKIGLEVPA